MVDSVRIVIPARYGSSRLEGKPLLEINGKPIFWHVFQRCLEAGFSRDCIFLATDHILIYDKAISLNVPVVMTSAKHESGTDRVYEVALKKRWADNVIVINVQGDEPAVPPTLIYALACFTQHRTEFSITTVVAPIKDISELCNKNIVKAIVTENDQALYFTRSPVPLNRDDPTDINLAYRHIGIYAYRVKSLSSFCSYSEAALERHEKLEQLRALSNGMTIGTITFLDDLLSGVDTLADYENLKYVMESQNDVTRNS